MFNSRWGRVKQASVIKIYLIIIFSNVKFENSDIYPKTAAVKTSVRAIKNIANFVMLIWLEKILPSPIACR